LFLNGIARQISAAFVFLAVFGLGWLQYRRSAKMA